MSTSTTILLLGFEPFAGDRENPSQDVVRALDGASIGDATISGVVLPVAFEAAARALDDVLARHTPAIVLALGLAGGRPDLTLERVALNLIDARIHDNDGAQPVDVPVLEGAPLAHSTTLPVKAMLAALRESGIPASLSLSAGTFVCNQVFYRIAEHAAHRPPLRAGFIHLPWLPTQAARLPGVQPSMALATMLDGVRIALACALATRDDLVVAGGTTC